MGTFNITEEGKIAWLEDELGDRKLTSWEKLVLEYFSDWGPEYISRHHPEWILETLDSLEEKGYIKRLY